MFKLIVTAAAISLLAACSSMGGASSTSTMGAGPSGNAGNSMGIHPAGGPN